MSNGSSLATISVIGLGYIGLPTAAMLASRRIEVIGVDVNPQVVEVINQGRIHIVEPELEAIVQRVVGQGYLRAVTAPQPADVFLIAVPTPLQADHQPDLHHVMAAAAAIAPLLKKGDLVILESTSPVGTTERMVQQLASARADLRFPTAAATEIDINVAYCPERVLPGRVVRELVETDRIIGGMTAACSKRAAEVYRLFVEGELLTTDVRTAEMAKLSENAFRDVNIAFANELSMICDKLGIEVGELIKLANHHPRVNILQPGCGVGGHCIAIDPWFIVDQAPDEARLIRTARQVNDLKPHWVAGKVDEAVRELSRLATGSEISLACFGLAYKADSDDLRESPAVKIVQILAAKYPGQVVVVEPNLTVLPQSLADLGVRLVANDEALRCRVLVRLVEHKQFKGLAPAVNFVQRLVVV
jgi:UDP-N-acetyl-D-mannosaminuronic acid dehydrogenase